MPARTLALIVMTLATVASGARAVQPRVARPLPVCAMRAPPARSGPSAPHGECPGISQAMARLGLAAFLPSHWQQSLTPQALDGLFALARRYRGAPPSTVPDAAALSALALTLEPRPPPPSWWARVKTWIGRHTGPLRRMIERWVKSMARTTGKRTTLGIFLVLGGLLLATALIVIVVELRGSRLIGAKRPRRRRLRAQQALGIAPDEPAADWTQLREHPAGLMRLLVDALARSSRIDRERHLTWREICALGRFDRASQRRDFLRVATLAERELFGPAPPLPLPDDILGAARTLHGELLQPHGGGGTGAP